MEVVKSIPVACVPCKSGIIPLAVLQSIERGASYFFEDGNGFLESGGFQDIVQLLNGDRIPEPTIYGNRGCYRLGHLLKLFALLLEHGFRQNRIIHNIVAGVFYTLIGDL